MGIYISKQPNGKYCRFSGIVDCPTHINMTFDDLVYVINQMHNNASFDATEMVTQIVDYQLRPFKNVISDFQPINITTKKFLYCIQKMLDDNANYEEISSSREDELDDELTNEYHNDFDIRDKKIEELKKVALSMLDDYEKKKQNLETTNNHKHH